jgi:hypothetical protein
MIVWLMGIQAPHVLAGYVNVAEAILEQAARQLVVPWTVIVMLEQENIVVAMFVLTITRMLTIAAAAGMIALLMVE